MIEAIELTSTRRSRGAGAGPVAKVSFDVYPGQVTALLGSPGAGKSTVLRMMVELEPGGGRTLFGGRPYRALRPAVREVGLALNPDAVHPGRTVQAHLQLYSAGGGVPKARIAEVLEVAGLSTQATVRCGRLDPGQRQRLAIAAALLGDPAALILDEPHALDAHGMSWFHALIRAYAAQGRTVLVAATDPDTLAGTADHVVVLRRDEQDGISRVIASRSAAEVFEERRATVVQVRSPQAARLAAALETEGARLAPAGPGALQVRGLDRARIGEVAHGAGICLHELSEIGHDDDVFGLRPLPRQKELLPGLNRAASGWHSGVRVVAERIEEAEAEAEVAEAPPGEGAAAEAGQQAAGDVVAATVGAKPSQGGVAEAEQPAVSASASPAAKAEQQAVQVGGAPPGAGIRPSQDPIAGAHESAATDAEPSSQNPDHAEQQAVAADNAAAATADAQAGSAEPSVAGSWRSPDGGWSRAQDDQSQPSNRPAAPSTEPPAPAEASRRTAAFGVRWGRGKPAASQPPAPSVPETPAPTQPAVPFTVASAVETPGAGDGMTPWRAVAARASQQSQQQASVAEAAPAEQEASA